MTSPHLIFKSLLLCILTALSVSCNHVQEEYSRQSCYLVFDNSTHNDPTLAGGMTRYTGIFVTITTGNMGGAPAFFFRSNQGTASEQVFNAIDRRRSIILGMNGGLIIGYGTLSGEFYAFDRECPNCFDLNQFPIRSRPLSVNEAGLASCATCKRQYNLNNGGVVSSGNAGKKMIRYYASTTGPYGILSVH